MHDGSGELTEQGVLLKDVQDAVWDYLRVHLPRVLSEPILRRVQNQEELYRTQDLLRSERSRERAHAMDRIRGNYNLSTAPRHRHVHSI